MQPLHAYFLLESYNYKNSRQLIKSFNESNFIALASLTIVVPQMNKIYETKLIITLAMQQSIHPSSLEHIASDIFIDRHRVKNDNCISPF